MTKTEKIVTANILALVFIFLAGMLSLYTLGMTSKPAQTGCENNVYTHADYEKAQKYYDTQVAHGNGFPIWYRNFRNYLKCINYSDL